MDGSERLIHDAQRRRFYMMNLSVIVAAANRALTPTASTFRIRASVAKALLDGMDLLQDGNTPNSTSLLCYLH